MKESSSDHEEKVEMKVLETDEMQVLHDDQQLLSLDNNTGRDNRDPPRFGRGSQNHYVDDETSSPTHNDHEISNISVKEGVVNFVMHPTNDVHTRNSHSNMWTGALHTNTDSAEKGVSDNEEFNSRNPNKPHESNFMVQD